MHVLTVKYGNETCEFHMLNPGEIFPGFGGSRQGLVVGEGVSPAKRTASLIVRTINHDADTRSDMELDIHDESPWAAVVKWINAKPGEVTAEIPADRSGPKHGSQ